MTSPMTMNRVIHAAVRRDLTRLQTALGSVPDGDTTRARQLQRAFANLHRELKHHHESEDDLVFPFLAKVEGDGISALLKAMENEHDAMAAALDETSASMATYASNGSATEAGTAQNVVARTYVVVDEHLTHEENDLEPVLAPYLGTPEWKAIEKRLRPKSLSQSGMFLAWIQDGMTDEGRTYLHATIPRPVTLLLSRLAGRAYGREIAPVWRV